MFTRFGGDINEFGQVLNQHTFEISHFARRMRNVEYFMSQKRVFFHFSMNFLKNPESFGFFFHFVQIFFSKSKFLIFLDLNPKKTLLPSET